MAHGTQEEYKKQVVGVVCRAGGVGVSRFPLDSGEGAQVDAEYVAAEGGSLDTAVRDFQRVTLDPGQTKSVKFTIDSTDVGFYDNSGRFVVEPGTIDLYVGNSLSGGLKDSFTVAR